MAEEKLNLIQKLSKIRSMSDVVAKSKKGFNYSYTDITEILANVTAGMNKYGVSLIPMILPGSEIQQVVSRNTKFDKTGKAYENVVSEMLYSSDMIFKWVNDEDVNDFIEVPWFVTGSQSDPSQAFGSALTYCTRYFLCSYFQIAQPEKDVDEYRSKQKEAEASEAKATAEAIIKEFDTVVKKFLADNQEVKDDVVKFISRFAKGGNYFSIKEPTLAAKLLNDFKEKYKVEV